MNKSVYLLISAALLASCSTGGNQNSSSQSSSISEFTSSNESSSSESSSSSEPSSAESSSSGESSSEESEIKQRLSSLKEDLLDMVGNVNKSRTTLKRVFTYPSDGTFDMTVNSSYESTRYTRGTSYLTESKGTEQVEGGGALTYTSQLYDNGKKLTSIRTYSDGASEKNAYAYSSSSAEAVYSLSFVPTEVSQIEAMIANSGSSLAEIELSDITVNKGTYSYSYTYSLYEEEDGEKVLGERYHYENAISLSQGLATHLKQKYVGQKYSGGVCATLTADSEIDYFQGEYEEFSGELLS